MRLFRSKYKKTKRWLQDNERILMPATLVFGVIVDAFTFATINIVAAFGILFLHILFAGWVIAFINGYDAGVFSTKNKVFKFGRLLAPFALQFSFGALLSAVFIFYVFSGSLLVSWPFVLLVVILMISNDVLRRYYLRSRVQMGVFFFVLFLLTAVMIPYSLQKMGAFIFVVSGLVSVGLIYGYIKWLAGFIPSIAFGIKRFDRPIAMIFIMINALYFLNVIPPVPLALRDSVVAHDVSRSSSGYTLKVEKLSLLERLVPGQTITRADRSPVMVYTAVFAPGKLRARIYHHWQHKEKGRWVSKDRFSYTVFGGRQEGFRGYSQKATLEQGKWRVDVETERGQVMGRVRFSVEQGDPGEFKVITR